MTDTNLAYHDTTQPSPGEVDEAKKFPNGWIYRIAGDFAPEQDIPPEAIIGAWEVDANGEITGEFMDNPIYDAASFPPA